ncbi:MAG: SPFH domain-containing protein [Thermomicrobiales bacterium]
MVGSIVGPRGVPLIGQPDDHLKSIIINEFNDLCGETYTSLLDLAQPAMTSELANTMRASLTNAFRRVGLQLLTFQISSITPPEEVQEGDRPTIGDGAIGDMSTFMQYRTGQAIGDAAQNQGDGGSAMATGAGSARAPRWARPWLRRCKARSTLSAEQHAQTALYLARIAVSHFSLSKVPPELRPEDRRHGNCPKCGAEKPGRRKVLHGNAHKLVPSDI